MSELNESVHCCVMKSIQVSRTSALPRVGHGGMYPGRGPMSSAGAGDGRAY